MRLLDRELAKAVQLAIDAGELAPQTDPRQVAFEFIAIVSHFYRAQSLLDSEESRKRSRVAFDRLLEQHRP